VQRATAERTVVLLDQALERLFVASPLARAQLDAYSELLVPARARLFGMLATIGAEYPDLDKTRADDASDSIEDAEVVTPGHTHDERVGRMRSALEEAIAQIEQAGLLLRSDSGLSDVFRDYFEEYSAEARSSIESALEYLNGLAADD
jgi:hypothetical protein